MPDVKLSSLKIHPYNLEVYGEPDDGLRDGLKEFGLQHAILVDEERHILSGARRFAAAKALGWKTIKTETAKLNGASVEKFILLANAYRDKKSNYLKYREVTAWIELLQQGKVHRDEFNGADSAPSRKDRTDDVVAARVGWSGTMFRNMRRVLTPGYFDGKIKESMEAETIERDQVPTIRRESKKIQKQLMADEIAPDAADRALKQIIRDAEMEHKTAAERRQQEAMNAIGAAVRAGNTFIVAIEKLTHKKHAKYLTEAHAGQLYVKVKEIHHALHSLGKASRDLKGIDGHGVLTSS